LAFDLAIAGAPNMAVQVTCSSGTQPVAPRPGERRRESGLDWVGHPSSLGEMNMPSLTLAQANKIVETALAKAREMKIKPLAVAVLDESGHVKSLQREDGASMFRCDVAVGKAWASVGMGVASRTLLQRAKENPQFFGALSATAHGKFLPQTGAVVIKDTQGNVLGAAGASGGTGEEDEAVCIAGVEATGLVSG
jgi:uncharacterized protein GlcG (DUF336 family)